MRDSEIFKQYKPRAALENVRNIVCDFELFASGEDEILIDVYNSYDNRSRDLAQFFEHYLYNIK